MSCRRAFFSAALIGSYDGFCERSPRAVFLLLFFARLANPSGQDIGAAGHEMRSSKC